MMRLSKGIFFSAAVMGLPFPIGIQITHIHSNQKRVSVLFGISGLVRNPLVFYD
jgi:hypothetical protein